MRVHSRLGPGLLESVYHRCLCHELSGAEIPFDQQVRLPIHYDGINALHEAQLLTYLRLRPCRVGLPINFNTLSLIDGIRRRVV
jgi:hypothetical protein